MRRIILGASLLCFALASPSFASPISTQFNDTDGFITGDTDPVTLTNGALSVTFSGGQQQQMFDAESYNVAPAAYLFINGTFTGASGNDASGDGVDDDTGLIDFNIGVLEVSFFGANRGNGDAVELTIFGVDDVTELSTETITQTSNPTGAPTTITAADVGAPIGSIGIDLPGPNMMPPYVFAIDTFSVVDEEEPVVVPNPIPEPGAAILLGMGLLALGASRRRNRGEDR